MVIMTVVVTMAVVVITAVAVIMVVITTVVAVTRLHSRGIYLDPKLKWILFIDTYYSCLLTYYEY